MMRYLWFQLERRFLYNFIRLFRIRAASEKVARGFALGLIINFFPTFGFGVLISGLFARLFGGNSIAGLVGGATLTFAWPLLFYFNIRTGSLFRKPPLAIEDPQDMTPKAMDALIWGTTFTTGAILNAVLAGFAAYGLFRLVYHRIRPATLDYLRKHARHHQSKFGRIRPRFKVT